MWYLIATVCVIVVIILLCCLCASKEPDKIEVRKIEPKRFAHEPMDLRMPDRF